MIQIGDYVTLTEEAKAYDLESNKKYLVLDVFRNGTVWLQDGVSFCPVPNSIIKER
ncbi:hypothetical protein QJV45_02660 [Listeria booriae]|uniref:hypothetical protein n=1 Tax=Listeria booriae TaxID=1552123 RepID=UPI0028807B2F|nr:hypothetical protein [Listeria booriae]MDT0109344.1 hypothetical protein [Listeria booriae]